MHRFAIPALCSLLLVAAPACGGGGGDGGDTDNGDTGGPPPAGCDASISFADSALEACIRENVGKPTGDILYPDLAELTNLSCYGGGLTNLEGIQCAQRLERAYLDTNAIGDLEPLASLPSLTLLELGHNGISDISGLAAATSLEHLDLMANAVSDLSPLTGLTAISWLGLHNNNVADLAPLVANSGLATGDWVGATTNPIDCAGQAANIDALRARGVDLFTDCE